MGVFFNGRYYIKPTVATYVDDSALTPVGLVGANVIGMMGPAKDGVPNQAYLITSISDATAIFKEGPLVDGIMMAFNNGAQYIWATRLSGTWVAGTGFSSVATRASYGPTGPPAIPFKLWTTAYGVHANNAKVTFATNAGGGIDVTVAAYGNTIVGTGLKNNSMKIVNSGGASGTVVISNSTTHYNMTISDGTNSTAAIDLVGVANMIDLKQLIDAAMAIATPAPITTLVFTSLVDQTKPIELDSGTVTIVGTGGINYLSNTVKTVFDWLNSGAQGYVTAEDTTNLFTGALNKDISLLTGTLALTGGTYGSINATSYQGALADIYEDLDLDLVVPIVDDYLTYSLTGVADLVDSVFNYVAIHCKEMSTLKAEERMGFAGYMVGAADMTLDTDVDDYSKLIKKAATFDSPYMVICAPRIKTYSLKGQLKTFNGTYTAAAIAGLIAGFSVGEPITNKALTSVSDLSKIYKQSEILQLIDNGVLTIEKIRGVGVKVVQGITTWVADDNFNKKEISVRLVTNYVAKNCRTNLTQFIGRKNSSFMLETIKGSLTQVLKELENEGVIVGTLAYPAFRNMVLTADGDVVRISFECSPVLPINYILITIHATVFKATI